MPFLDIGLAGRALAGRRLASSRLRLGHRVRRDRGGDRTGLLDRGWLCRCVNRSPDGELNQFRYQLRAGLASWLDLAADDLDRLPRNGLFPRLPTKSESAMSVVLRPSIVTCPPFCSMVEARACREGSS